MKHHILTLALVGLCTLMGGTASRAGVGLDVSPAKLEVSITPGGPINLPIAVHNAGDSGVHVVASMADFDLTRAGDYEFKPVGALPHSLMRWAEINPREFDIPVGATQQVRLTFNIPSDKSMAGEYAGLILFQTRPERHGNGGVLFSARIVSKIYNTVPGSVKTAGEVESFTSDREIGRQAYHVLFKNTGNAHVYLNGRIEVRQGGQLVEKIALPGQLLVERDGERAIDVAGKSLTRGTYDVVAIVDYGGKTLTGGKIRLDVP